MKFRSISIWRWKQFDEVEIYFHPKLTILTGANGSGKSTLLNILSKHFGWNDNELSTPHKDTKTGGFRFFTNWHKHNENDDNQQGILSYDNGVDSPIDIPDENGPVYSVFIRQQQHVLGLYIRSHRPAFRYTQVEQVPTRKRSSQQAFQLSHNANQEWHNGNGGNPINFNIKETLISWVVNGYGNKVIEIDQEQIEFFEGFQNILRILLPKDIQFKELTIRNAEIVLIAGDDEFLLEAVSGGITSIISLAWDIYTFSLEHKKDDYVVVIDEIENHLHAKVQRTIMPDLLKAFPNVQFVVSTHSPLIVGSVKDSNVYALTFGEQGVISAQLDLINKAQSAQEILKDVLGVPFTMPVWVEDQLDRITTKYSVKKLDASTSSDMRNELKEIGLEQLIPEATIEVIDKQK